MNNEIKEIIESSRKIIKSNRENDFDRIIMLGDDIDKLLDYITNLQDKYERMKENAEILSNGYNDLEKRNEKAIDLLEPLIDLNGTMTAKGMNKLLIILQGEDKDE